MSKLICFYHRNYSGAECPDLECAICCEIFILKLKEQNLHQNVEQLWMSLKDNQLEINKRRAIKKLSGSSRWVSTK
jgi:hypothetical protein